tara:strand:- start:338 stop:577 length:240 start_codon:yes stop_codon:yes gene_type:complete
MWNQKESPLRIEKRFEFENFQYISKFMALVDELCKAKNIYPNISFGKTFVSITIFIEEGKSDSLENDFAKNIDIIFEKI